MKEVTRLFSDLKNISGNIAKADFIKTNMSNKTFMNSLKFLIRTDNPTGISTKKYDKWEDSDSMFIDENKNPPRETTLEDIFTYLEVHNSGRDEDIRYIRMFGNIWCEDEEDKEFYKRIICKDYPIGVDSKSLNKIIPNFIPTFDVMLANSMLKMEQKQIDKLTDNGTREFAITEKCDGFRCVAIKENGNVKLVSRQGKLYEGCVDIEKAIKELPQDNFVLDSEIIISNRSSIPSKDQYKATSNIVTTKDTEKHNLTLNVFDYIDLEEWNSKECKTMWCSRNIKLMDLLEDYSDKDDKPLYRLPLLYVGSDLEVAYNLLAKAREENKEGVMLRFTDSMYEFKRSNDLLKLKAMSEVDAYIVGYEEGENKNVGKLGAFLCEVDLKNYGKLKFKCGSGYSDEERDNYWQHKDELIGRVIEVQYFEITQNSTTKEYSVRFPVHKCIKPIGTEPNN